MWADILRVNIGLCKRYHYSGTTKLLTSGMAPHLDEGSEDPTMLTACNKDTGEKKQATKVDEGDMVLRQRQRAHSDVATTLQVGILL
jgi:hypothetical protein